MAKKAEELKLKAAEEELEKQRLLEEAAEKEKKEREEAEEAER